MYKARYYKADGKKGRARALPETLFDGVVNESVLHQVVKAHLSNRRQGTAAAKNRSAVAGGSRKPWRQKGTGRARAGTIRAPHWEGGGVAFPPIPHSWRQRVPRRVRALARRSAFNDRAERGSVVLADLPVLERPRTKELLAFLSAMEVSGKVLILTDGVNRNVYLSARNLPDVQVLPFGHESAYDILWAGTVVIERAALEAEAAGKDAPAAAEPEAGETAAGEAEGDTTTAAEATGGSKEAPEAEAVDSAGDEAAGDETEEGDDA